MLTNLTAEVRDFRIDNFWQPILEAITNSLQANASKIELTFFKDTTQGQLLSEDKRIDAFEIRDNGDGFNETNRHNFKQLKATKFSKDVAKKGCKGMGRLSYLKVFEEIEIVSFTGSEKVEFKFTENFDHTKLSPVTNTSDKSTKISFKKPTKNILKYDAKGKLKSDGRGILDLLEIKQRVLNHLLPTLFFKKNSNSKNFKIIFSDGLKEQSIEPKDVPDFNDDKFFELTAGEEKANFILLYNISTTDNPKGIVHAHYCANQRAVCEFSKKGVIVAPVPNKIITFLLVSEFFDRDDIIKDTREDFYILPKERSVLVPFNWDDDINPNLKQKIVEVLSLVIPDYEKEKTKQKAAIIEKRPYLAKFVLENDAIGILDAEKEIKNAQKAFNDEKNICLDLVDSGKLLNTEEKEKLKDVLSIELSEYMWLRYNRIKDIKKLLENKESNEKLIHDLFLPQGTILNEETLLMDDIHKNNLWLVDDRFMSYRYAFSDKKIKKIKEIIGDTFDPLTDSKEPDFLVAFDNLLAGQNDLRGVALELKPFNCDYDANKKGITQLIDYKMAFFESEKIRESWYYMITNIDSAFENYLIKGLQMKQIFSSSGKIFFDSDKMIFVMPIETLIKECEKRHEIFFEILKKQYSNITK